MQEHKASGTAAGVALLRVLHQKVDGEPRILDDPISERLLDPRGVMWAMTRLDQFQTPWSRGLRTHVVVRSRFSEDALSEAVKSGLHQVVILGAGLDTFAYRQPAWARDVSIFEVDHPASQEDKRRRLSAGGVEVPWNVVYCPVDFEKESLREGLTRAGVDFAQATFFSCLGVVMYLTDAAVSELLALLGGFPERSELVLTFSPTGERSEGHRQLEEKVAEAGEPLQNFMSEEELAGKLRGAGFREVRFVSSEEIGVRYIGERTDGLKAPSRGTLAWARR